MDLKPPEPPEPQSFALLVHWRAFAVVQVGVREMKVAMLKCGVDPMRRIPIVDDCKAWRENVCRIIATQSELQVVAQSASGEDTVGLAEDLQPDFVVLDIELSLNYLRQPFQSSKYPQLHEYPSFLKKMIQSRFWPILARVQLFVGTRHKVKV